MKRHYPKSKQSQQQQIENLLKVYDFLGRQKKNIPQTDSKATATKTGGLNNE